MSSLLRIAHVDQHLVVPYSHNRKVENCNRRVMEIMRALVLEEYLGPNSRLRWSLLLPQVRRTLMTRTVNQHGCTPNDLAYMRLKTQSLPRKPGFHRKIKKDRRRPGA